MKRLFPISFVLLIALLLLTTGAALASPSAQRVIFDNLFAQRLTVIGATEMRGAVTFDDDATLTGVLISPGTVIAVTDEMVVTPLSSYQPLISAGDVSTVTVAGCDEGRRLTLVNEANTTITFNDTGTLKLSANAALGQFDSLSLLCDGTNWIETARANN